MVLGDFNTFQFTDDFTAFLLGQEPILSNFIDTLRDDNVYTFNFEGNSQVLDHVIVTRILLRGAQLDIIHVNMDFPGVDDTVASDQESLLARFRLGGSTAMTNKNPR